MIAVGSQYATMAKRRASKILGLMTQPWRLCAGSLSKAPTRRFTVHEFVHRKTCVRMGRIPVREAYEMTDIGWIQPTRLARRGAAHTLEYSGNRVFWPAGQAYVEFAS